MKGGVFVLGDTGLVGRACVQLFSQNGWEVYGFSRQAAQQLSYSNYYHFSIDISTQPEEFFQQLTTLKPSIVLFTAGNHSKEETKENIQMLSDLHLGFIPRLVDVAVKEQLRLSIVCCSSWMAYVPDRIYPSYAAVKAALNHYVSSASIALPARITLQSVVLGPIAEKPEPWFEKSAQNVARRLSKLALDGNSGVHHYPKYGKLLQLSAGLIAKPLEKLIFRKRRL